MIKKMGERFPILYSKQLAFLEYIKDFLRSEWLSPLFILLNALDSPLFVLSIVLLVWIRFGYRKGAYLFFLTYFASSLLFFIKHWANEARPPQFLRMVSVSSPSFPSGAAFLSFVLFGYLAIIYKKGWNFFLMSLLIVLFGLSRVYLGVHYPTDILAGWFFGALTLLLYVRSIPPIESLLQKLSTIPLLLAAICIETLLLLVNPINKEFLILYLLAISISIGLSIRRSYVFTMSNKATTVMMILLELFILAILYSIIVPYWSPPYLVFPFTFIAGLIPSFLGPLSANLIFSNSIED